nr:MAG TPA: hypothetical protein [Caudoviricetes sp.]
MALQYIKLLLNYLASFRFLCANRVLILKWFRLVFGEKKSE